MVRFILRLFILLLVLLVAGMAYALWPRQGDLRGFDPDAVARLETGMWRDYYDHDHQGLIKKLYALYRDEYHFSPGDSAQLAYASEKAAQLFQPTDSREKAQVALPLLVQHYTLLRARSGETFSAEEAARLELDWWQRRREGATSAEYGEVVAEVSREVFGVDNEHLQRAALLRAQMMAYRDERRGRMEPEDWKHIEKNLIESYRELRTGVTRPR